ncbi:MAG: hypothetical protein HY556_02830 [Euryarchaeota archaeon]|nr:hypothetical protein [Euryarchaeota archaeon]
MLAIMAMFVSAVAPGVAADDPPPPQQSACMEPDLPGCVTYVYCTINCFIEALLCEHDPENPECPPGNH